MDLCGSQVHIWVVHFLNLLLALNMCVVLLVNENCIHRPGETQVSAYICAKVAPFLNGLSPFSIISCLINGLLNDGNVPHFI